MVHHVAFPFSSPGSALQDEIKSCTAVLMHTSSRASFSNYGIYFIPKVRVPSSSHKKIINIVELCPTVDGPLERTSEGNPRVQYVDQVQNPTKNPFDVNSRILLRQDPPWGYFSHLWS